MVRETHFSSAGPVLRNVGGIKCQSFLTTGNEDVLKWNLALRLLTEMETRAFVNCLASW